MIKSYNKINYLSRKIINVFITIYSMKKLKEKAQLEFNCKTVNQLIDVLEDIRDVMGGNISVGRVSTLRPSINVQLFNHNNSIVVLN